MTEITNKIYYVGVNDRNKHRFEGLWPVNHRDENEAQLVVSE